MAKKSSKTQPKRPSITNLDNAVLPAITTNQSASTTQTNIQAAATMCHSFFYFVTLVTIDNIKIFLNFTATTPEGQNITHLWQQAYKHAYENGKKSLLQNLERKMEEKFEEGVARGMGLGREEGYAVAKQGFDRIVKALKDREQSKKVSTSDFGTQTDSPHTTTTSISVQTNTTTLPIISQARKFVENGVGTSLTPTVDFSIQTSPGVVHTLPLATFNDQTELLVPLHLETIKKLNLHSFPPKNWQNQLFQHVLTGLTMPTHSQSHPHPHLPIHLVTSCVSVPPCHIHSHCYDANTVTQIGDGMLNVTVMVITVT